MNFGFSRGMGSLFYAVVAVVLGRLVEGFGKNMIMQSCLGNVIIIIILICFMPDECASGGLSGMFLFVCIATAGGCLLVLYLLHAKAFAATACFTGMRRMRGPGVKGK